jgi:hypothetical protein
MLKGNCRAAQPEHDLGRANINSKLGGGVAQFVRTRTFMSALPPIEIWSRRRVVLPTLLVIPLRGQPGVKSWSGRTS